MIDNIEFPKPKTFYQEVEEIMNIWERQTQDSRIESALTIRTMADTIYKKRLEEDVEDRNEDTSDEYLTGEEDL